MIRIDESNFNYLVRIDIEKYTVTLYYGIPRKSAKGYVGTKHFTEEKEFIYQDEAQLQFANWREDYIYKYNKGELVDLFIGYYPLINHYVTCPKCNKDAEIITWMGLMGWGEEEYGVHNICCKHCAKSDRFEDFLDNRIGIVTFCLMNNEEELNIRLQHHTSIKWEEFLEKGFYKDNKENVC